MDVALYNTLRPGDAYRRHHWRQANAEPFESKYNEFKSAPHTGGRFVSASVC